MIAALQEEMNLEKAGACEVRRATPADRDALVEMYLSFEPKGAALGLPPYRQPET